MSELQAVLDCQVELSKFYNIDLFQRGYYQIRTSLKLSQKATAKVDVSVQRSDDRKPMSPRVISGSVAVSKTFQILYRKEDVDLDDVFTFKIYMIADVFKIDQSLSDADFQLSIELWFTEDEIQADTIFQCVSSRTLRLHIRHDQGLHHHVPVQFDYFHLSTVCVTVHATLIALHLSYISLNGGGSHRSSVVGMKSDPTVLPSEFTRPSGKATRRVQQAFERHRHMCRVLLSAYESLQSSYNSLVVCLPANKQLALEHVDCVARYDEMVAKCQRYTLIEEEDMVQATQSDVATLCGQNILLWVQYLELVTLKPRITHQLAKEHHTLRVKRFAEAFFINEFHKQEMIVCFDQNVHGHADIAGAVRSSIYYQMLPPLHVECTEIDGDISSLPILFEDIYVEQSVAAAVKPSPILSSEFKRNDSLRVPLRRPSPASSRPNRASVCSTSSTASDSSVQGGRKSGKMKFIRNVRPESFRRPSSMINNQLVIEGQVATDQKDCTLVGYRKTICLTGQTRPIEIGTLNTQNSTQEYMGRPDPDETNSLDDEVPVDIPVPVTVTQQHNPLFNAISLPTLYTEGLKSDAIVTSSVAGAGSLPTLSTDVDLNVGHRRPYWHCGPDADMQCSSSSSEGNQPRLPIDMHDITLCESTESGLVQDTTLVGDSEQVQSPVETNVNSYCAAVDSVHVFTEHDESISSKLIVNNGAMPSAASKAEDISEVDDGVSRKTEVADEKSEQPAESEYTSSGRSIDQSDTDISTESSPSMSTQLSNRQYMNIDQLAEDSGNGSQSEISNRSTDVNSTTSSFGTLNYLSGSNVKVQVDSGSGQSISDPVGNGQMPVSDSVCAGRLAALYEPVDAVTASAESAGAARVASLTKPAGDTGCAARLAALAKPMISDSQCAARLATLAELADDTNCVSRQAAASAESTDNSRVAARLAALVEPEGIDELDIPMPVDNDEYLSGQCTMMELIREEGERAKRLGMSSTLESDPPINGVTLPDEHPPFSDSRKVEPSEKPTKKLVQTVRNETVRFVSAKEMLRKQLNYSGHFYSDFPIQASAWPYFWPNSEFPNYSPGSSPVDGIHLVICVHGLDGNSTDLRLVRTYLELALPGGRLDFLMSERNQTDTFADFEVMTDRLVQEILYHIDLYGIKPARISFIGHSLGNLIIRSAMSRPQLAELLPKLHTFLSLSGPHLGTLFNSSGLVNMGMWIMQKWKKSGSLLQLSMKDHSDPRQSFLYKLSQKTGLEFFRNILLVGSQQDRYVPYHSSRIELCKAAVKDSSGLGAVYTEMVNNILQPIIYKSDINFVRYDVYHALPSSATNNLIGRAAHIAVLDSELFIEKFVTVAALKYFI